MQADILTVTNLSKVYKQKATKPFSHNYIYAVDDISLNVKKGECVGIIGESGCGKSTVLKSILHLIPPTSGSVVFENLNLSSLSKNKLNLIRPHFQLIFQNPKSSLNPFYSALKQVSEGVLYHNIVDKSKAYQHCENILTLCGLDKNSFNKLPSELSGGQCSRVAIAKSLALNPRLIFADEIVSSLDVSVQAQILNLLNKLKEQFKLSFVFVSHDLSVVRYFCDKVYVMYLGQIVEYGLSNQVFSSPLHPYTRALLSTIPSVSYTNGAVTFKSQKLIPLTSDPPSPSIKHTHCKFLSRCQSPLKKCFTSSPTLTGTANHKTACFMLE